MKTLILENQRSYSFVKKEAERCLLCYDPPCTEKCPAHIDIPGFIMNIRSGNLEAAYHKIVSANPFANTCGYVCPDEVLCQSVCIRAKLDEPIRIRELHCFVTESVEHLEIEMPQKTKGKKVAVIGGGPAGLTCALKLWEKGIEVDVFEKDKIGGIPVVEIPSDRLPQSAVERDISKFRLLGIRIHEKTEVKSLSELSNYDAIVVATGVTTRKLDISGIDLEGVIDPKELLRSYKKGRKEITGKRAVVIGGGNVALDAAYVLKEMGNCVIVTYRRELQYAPSWTKEKVLTFLKGVEFMYLVSPVAIKGEKRVEAVEFVRMRLGEPDESGRPVPVPIEGSNFTLSADIVVPAIGETAPDIFPELERDDKGYVKTDSSYMTNIEGVFAIGDITGKGGTIVEAVAQGKSVSEAVINYLGRAR